MMTDPDKPQQEPGQEPGSANTPQNAGQEQTPQPEGKQEAAPTQPAPETPATPEGNAVPAPPSPPPAPAPEPAAQAATPPPAAAPMDLTKKTEAPAQNAEWQRNKVELDEIRQSVQRIKGEIRKVIVGQEEMVELLMAGLIAGGHVLLEGVPGIAKTLSAKLLAQSLSVDFSRIQFTPDMMPTDITGTSIFNMKTSEFSFNKGPIFSNVVLIDEINRAPAKTQSALFEVMEEQQVTVDGVTYSLDFPFIVIATQNPIEQEGTYMLPEAQLDRFLFKIKLTYPSLDDEVAILQRFKSDFDQSKTAAIKPVINPAEILKCRKLAEQVYIKDELVKYIAQIVHETRNNGDLFLGASPRASLSILRASKAFAALGGRDFVTPDDIKRAAYPVLNHRMILTPDREMDGTEPEDVIKAIIQKIEVPR